MNEKRIKQIARPSMEGKLTKMSAMELNKVRFSTAHTVLTPELLRKNAGKN